MHALYYTHCIKYFASWVYLSLPAGTQTGLLEVHFTSSPPMEKSNFLYAFVCAENFFVCAQFKKKLFKKQIFKVSGLLEKWKFEMDRSSRKWCHSFVLHLCWFVLQFFSFVLHPFSNGGRKHPYNRVKFQNGPIGAKVVSIVCASFVLAGYAIFFLLCSIRSRVMDQIPHFKVTHSIVVSCWRNENSKWPDLAQNGVNSFCFVCAGELRDFVHLCHTSSRTGCKNISYIW